MNLSAVINDYYKHFNSKNWDGMASLLDENVVHDINQGDSMKGKDVFRKFLDRMDFLYEEKLSDFHVMANAQENVVFARFICDGTYKNTDKGLPEASGQKYSLPVICYFEFKEGKISRVTNFYNMTAWLKMIQK